MSDPDEALRAVMAERASARAEETRASREAGSEYAARRAASDAAIRAVQAEMEAVCERIVELLNTRGRGRMKRVQVGKKLFARPVYMEGWRIPSTSTTTSCLLLPTGKMVYYRSWDLSWTPREGTIAEWVHAQLSDYDEYTGPESSVYLLTSQNRGYEHTEQRIMIHLEANKAATMKKLASILECAGVSF